jgi:hypothetical protein
LPRVEVPRFGKAGEARSYCRTQCPVPRRPILKLGAAEPVQGEAPLLGYRQTDHDHEDGVGDAEEQGDGHGFAAHVALRGHANPGRVFVHSTATHGQPDTTANGRRVTVTAGAIGLIVGAAEQVNHSPAFVVRSQEEMVVRQPREVLEPRRLPGRGDPHAEGGRSSAAGLHLTCRSARTRTHSHASGSAVRSRGRGGVRRPRRFV